MTCSIRLSVHLLFFGIFFVAYGLSDGELSFEEEESNEVTTLDKRAAKLCTPRMNSFLCKRLLNTWMSHLSKRSDDSDIVVSRRAAFSRSNCAGLTGYQCSRLLNSWIKHASPQKRTSSHTGSLKSEKEDKRPLEKSFRAGWMSFNFVIPFE